MRYTIIWWKWEAILLMGGNWVREKNAKKLAF
jgi:hypothetical protein